MSAGDFIYMCCKCQHTPCWCPKTMPPYLGPNATGPAHTPPTDPGIAPTATLEAVSMPETASLAFRCVCSFELVFEAPAERFDELMAEIRAARVEHKQCSQAWLDLQSIGDSV